MISLTDLTLLVLQLNSAIDSGKYDNLSIAEVHRRIEAGNLLRWLKDTIQYFDASLWLDRSPPDPFPQWYDEKIQAIYFAYAGNERRKWGVENRGLCLLLAWTNELIQQREGIKFNRD